MDTIYPDAHRTSQGIEPSCNVTQFSIVFLLFVSGDFRNKTAKNSFLQIHLPSSSFEYPPDVLKRSGGVSENPKHLGHDSQGHLGRRSGTAWAMQREKIDKKPLTSNEHQIANRIQDAFFVVPRRSKQPDRSLKTGFETLDFSTGFGSDPSICSVAYLEKDCYRELTTMPTHACLVGID